MVPHAGLLEGQGSTSGQPKHTPRVQKVLKHMLVIVINDATDYVLSQIEMGAFEAPGPTPHSLPH